MRRDGSASGNTGSEVRAGEGSFRASPVWYGSGVDTDTDTNNIDRASGRRHSRNWVLQALAQRGGRGRAPSPHERFFAQTVEPIVLFLSYHLSHHRPCLSPSFLSFYHRLDDPLDGSTISLLQSGEEDFYPISRCSKIRVVADWIAGAT